MNGRRSGERLKKKKVEVKRSKMGCGNGQKIGVRARQGEWRLIATTRAGDNDYREKMKRGN